MPRTAARGPRHLLAVLLAATTAVGIGACGDDDDGGDDGTTTSTTAAVDSTISTMAPDTTGGAGNITVPGDEDDTGATDTTVSGAVPGQEEDQLDPPGDLPGGPSPEG